MASIIVVDDLPTSLQSNEMVYVMVAGANATASRVAPCLADISTPPSDDQVAEAKLVLIGAIRRWADAGSGGIAHNQAGPFGQTLDTRQRTGYNLWPSEIERLQDICKGVGEGGQEAFSIAPSGSGVPHAPYCDLYFGGAVCTCGVSIGIYPDRYETWPS